MKRILGYMAKYWYYYCAAIIFMLISIFLDFKNPVIMGRIIDEVIIDEQLEIFKSLLLMIAGITIGRAILGYLKEVLFDIVGIKILCELRQTLFDHIQSLSETFFAKKTTGELMSRVKEDTEKIWFGISFGMMLVIEMAIYFVAAIILMLQVSPKLSIIVLVTMPVIGFLAVRLENTIGKVYDEISEQNAKLNTVAQENIAGVRLVKAFARETHEVNKFLKQNKKYYSLNVQQMKIWSRFFPTIEFIANLLPVLVIVIGGAYVIGEELTIGTLVRFSQYTYMVIWPMRLMGWLSSLMAEANASTKKIEKIFEHQSDIINRPDAIKVDRLEGQLQFNNVSLTLDDTEILKDINFTIKKGGTFAIMGEAGSGKSLLISLLTRFYNKTSGNIRIDGYDIEELDIQTLRKNISLVMQDTFLFSDTIEENIKLGAKNIITSENMYSAAKSAEAHEFISRMESNYETIIGEKGIGLSGGQKQRISIARAFAKNAPLLVFDDSTSALDMETEKRVQKEINKLKGVTKILIAHRVSTVRNADEIIILEKGEIIERGTHEELLEKKGRYYETYVEQYEGYNNLKSEIIA